VKVNFLDLKAQYLSIQDEIDQCIKDVLNSTAFAAGPFVKSFEDHFAEKHQAEYCIGVNSGTAALHIALMSLGITTGDEVIVPADTFFATPEAVSLTGATPVFVDCESDYYNIDTSQIEKAITPKTRAIIAVHLYGQPADLDPIVHIAEKNNLHLIEDCAQAHLATYKDKPVGTFGVAGCFSFYPGKNLGAYGEGGAVITNDKQVYETIMMLRDHGMKKKYHHDIIGHNYRMEGIQGAILDVKLNHLEKWTEIRRQNSEFYRTVLKTKDIKLPKEAPYAKHVYHLFTILSDDRDNLIAYLKEHDVYTGIHYPIPCHLQNAYKDLGYQKGSMPVSESIAERTLSLPMSEQLTKEQVEHVAETIDSFYSEKR
jgi:dTDP-4-amino-4,6-dideoxygalactose transaminase